MRRALSQKATVLKLLPYHVAIKLTGSNWQ